MTEPHPPHRTINAGALVGFAAVVLERAGLVREAAGLVADSLVQADLWGHQSHGVMRLPWYVARLRSGAVRADAELEFVTNTAVVAVLDGHDAMGQIAARRAAQSAIDRAKKFGIGAVAVRNSNHFGTAMYFTLMAAREGCIGFLSTNSSPAMSAWGGKTRCVGTNPWSWAAPAGRFDPLVLDIANTAVARGKIHVAKKAGLPIPLGWALDSQGRDTTDPLEALAGVVLPMAGHKGYAVAVIMDMLSGVLSGSEFGARVAGPYQPDARSGAGHLIIALNISSFLAEAEFAERMEVLLTELKAAPRANGSKEILYPGELEARNDRANRSNGLRLPPDTVADLEAVSRLLDCQEAFENLA